MDQLFAGAFRYVQPYGCLDDNTRLEAARDALERTRTAGDGPWIERASFVATIEEKPVGAILITLLPEGDPCDWESYHWIERAAAGLHRTPLGSASSNLGFHFAAGERPRHRHRSPGRCRP